MLSRYRRLLNVVLATSLCVALGGLAPVVAQAEELTAEDETVASTEAIVQEGDVVADPADDVEQVTEEPADAEGLPDAEVPANAEVVPVDAEGVVTLVEPEATQVDEDMVDDAELDVTGEEPTSEGAVEETDEPAEADGEAVGVAETGEEGLAEAEARLMATSPTALLGATATTLDGVDISGHNSRINIANLDADFVIIKATEWNPDKKNYTSYTTGNTGNTYPSYTAQADAALAAGKLIGFYHFVTNPSMGAGWTAQAQGFINAVSGYLGQAILVLDWENTSYSTVESNVSGAKEWLDYVYEHTGVRPLIYMNKSCSQSYNWSSVANAGYELWGAQYADMKHHSGYETNPWQSSSSWGAWGSRPTIFQYSSTTTVTGSGGNVDVNKFYGTRDDWIAHCGGREMAEGTYDASALLQHGSVYSFSSLPNSTIVVAGSSDNVLLGSGNYLSGYWQVANLGDGLYSFANMSDGRLLSFADGATRGTNVGLSGSLSTWRLIKCTNGAIALVPLGFDNLRLDVTGGAAYLSKTGTNMELYTRKDAPWQQFFFVKSNVLTNALSSGKNIEPGVYTIVTGISSGMAVDVHGASTANNANVEIYKSNNGLNQRYQFIYQGNGLYKIKVLRSNLYLDVAGASRENCANVIQYAGNAGLNQLWRISRSGSGFAIESALSGKVLDIWRGESKNGTNVQVYRPNGGNNQRFSLVMDAPLSEAASLGVTLQDGFYAFASLADDGLTVDVFNASTANKANAIVYTAKGSRNQLFEVVYCSNGLYRIRPSHSGKSLDVSGASRTSGASVIQYQANTGVNQLWYFVRDGEGYAIKSALTGYVLTIKGDVSRGSSITAASDSAKPEQRFSVVSRQPFANGTYALTASVRPYAIVADIKGGSSDAGTPLIGYQPNCGSNQLFVLTGMDSGTYTIQSKKSGLFIGASGGSGSSVIQSAWSDSDSLLWRVSVNDSGNLMFINVSNGCAMEIGSNKPKNCVAIHGGTRNNVSASQSWALISESEVQLKALIGNMVYYTDVANVGYSQGANRNHLYDGGECDCSSLVIGCLKRAGFATGSAESTRDLRKNLVANGWTVMDWNINDVRAGDILICDGYHTCAVVSGFGRSAKIAEAWLNEFGGINGGKAGDQGTTDGLGETRVRTVYQYPSGGGWKAILRYAA